MGILIAWLAAKPYRNLLSSLIVGSWAFYLCLWIRSLDADFRSPFWCDVYLLVEVSWAALTIHQNPTVLVQEVAGVLKVASVVLGIATIYMIRADLQKHYNEREPIGLQLSGAMTWFFSFLYFQAELYPIAQSKKRKAEAMLRGSGNALFE